MQDVAVQVSGRILNLALGVVVTIVLVRTLGAGPYGQFMTILATFQLLGVLTSLGLEAVVVREAAKTPERTREWVGALMLIRTVLTLPATIGALVVLLLIRDGDDMLWAGLVLLLQFPAGLGSSLQVVHQLRVSNGVPIIVLTINSVVWGVSIFVISLMGGGLIAVAIALTAVTAMTSTIQAVLALRIIGFRLTTSKPAVVELLRAGAPVGLASLFVTAYARIDQLIVFEQAGSVAAGLYGSVYRLLEQAHFVPISVLTTIAPILAATWPADRDRALRIAGLAAEFLMVGSIGALVYVSVASQQIVDLLFGAEFRDAASALPVLGGAFVFICFGYLIGNLLLVLRLTVRQLVVAVIGLIVNVAGNLALVPRYGFMGAAWMTLVTEVVVVGIGAVIVIRAMDIRRFAPGPTLRILSAGALLLVVLLVVRALAPSIVALTLTACVMYPALLLGLRAVRVDDLRTLLSRPAQSEVG